MTCILHYSKGVLLMFQEKLGRRDNRILKMKTTPSYLHARNGKRRLRYQHVKVEEALAMCKELKNKQPEVVNADLSQQLSVASNRVCELEEEILELKEANASQFKREGKLLLN